MPRSSYVSRACDACKRRKVKCDATEPCGNCRISQLHCTYTIVPRRRGRNVRKQPLENPRSPGPASTASDVGTPSTSSPGTHIDGHFRSLRPNFAPSDHVPRLQVSYAVRDGVFDAMSIRTNMVAHLHGLLDGTTVEDVATRCIDLFIQFIFPHTPVGHEPTLRACTPLLRLKEPPAYLGPTSHLSGQPTQLALMKSFTLITALCALVTSVVPESLIPQKDILTNPFLQASRAMLLNYESHDLEHPDSTSLLIRAWHGSAMQNSSGKPGAAAHCHLGAALLALRLRLYEESALVRPSAMETQLLRSIFWLLYLADSASAVLETREYIIHDGAFERDLTTLEYADPAETPQLDMTRTVNQAPLESRLQIAYHLKRRMWTAAIELLSAIKARPLINASYAENTAGGRVETLGSDRLVELYRKFTSLIENIPDWLRHPGRHIDGASDPEAARCHETCLVAARSNIITSFHCVKLIILQKCIHHDARWVVGLGESKVSWDLRKMEIVQDFLHELQNVPFIVFKTQGEPAVERTRRTGSILLELVQNASNESIKAQAKYQFTQLLDYLAQLDSRASDALGGESVPS